MAIELTMPRLSDTMETGTIVKWIAAVGDEVSTGDVVADVETDKATMELSVYDDGRMASILVEEGVPVPVGTVVAMLAETPEEFTELSEGDGDGQAKPDSPSPIKIADVDGGGEACHVPDVGVVTTGDEVEVVSRAPGEGGARISPVARLLAEDHGLDLDTLHGSGPGGRIIKRDVLAAIDVTDEVASALPPSASLTVAGPAGRGGIPPTPVDSIPETSMLGPSLSAGRYPLSSMRQTIAQRLVESTRTIPHYQVTMVFDMDPLMTLRTMLNEQLSETGVVLSINDFLVRCAALAMHQHPDFNASFDDDAIVVHGAVNIGVAISMPQERGGGLVVGVIRHADQKSLRTISAESKALAEKARTVGLSVEEMSGSTFTVSNLGMFGVEDFTAIINPPNSAILATGAAKQQPVVREGTLTIGYEMKATLSSDHRIIDGAMAAQFLGRLREFIENPSVLLV